MVLLVVLIILMLVDGCVVIWGIIDCCEEKVEKLVVLLI